MTEESSQNPKEKQILFLKQLMEKYHLTDYDKVLLAVTKILQAKNPNQAITTEIIEKQFGTLIQQILSQEEPPKTPFEEEKKQLFFRLGRLKIDDILQSILTKSVPDSTPTLTDEHWEKISRELLSARTEILSLSKISEWTMLEPFILKYLAFHHEHPEVFARLDTEEEKSADEEMWQMLKMQRSPFRRKTDKAEDDTQEQQEMEDADKFLSEDYQKRAGSIVRKYSVDPKFNKDFHFLIKDFATKSQLFGESLIAMEFFDLYRPQFKEEMDKEERTELLKALSAKVQSIKKSINYDSLFDERISEIESKTKEIIKKIFSDPKKGNVYEKMKFDEILDRIDEILTMDKDVGGIVSYNREKSIPLIRRVIKSHFSQWKIFKRFL